METSFELTRRQRFFVESTKDFADKRLKPLIARNDNSNAFPSEALSLLAESHLLGLLPPKEEGGEGAGFFDLCLALEELARVCPVSALVCSVQNIGAWLLTSFGTTQQKNKYLMKLMDGSSVFGFLMPEPVLFDFLESSLLLSKEKLSENIFLISGSDIYVMNGDVAHVIMLSAKEDGSFTSCFLVDRGTRGLDSYATQGMNGAEARYTFKLKMENCPVPVENLLGEEGLAENVLVDFLSKDCCLTAARALGISRSALDFALEYSKDREQFGKRISQFHAIQMMLGDMCARVEAMRSIVYKAASAIDQKSGDADILAAIAKYFTAESAMKVTKDALQVSGGYGLMKDYPIERLIRNAQLTQISQGSLHNQRLTIAKLILK
jgi:butyryl-CoA dehydrogenase